VQTIGVNPYDSELYLYNADGTNATLLVSNLPGRVDSPSFSINGLNVVYTRDTQGFNDPTGRQLDAHIIIQRTDGTGTPVDVSANTLGTTKVVGTNDLYPRYTSDGFHLIFVNAPNPDGSTPNVWTCELDGRGRIQLFQNATLPDNK
jgi:TolB protein